jgi:hypothetical protein
VKEKRAAVKSAKAQAYADRKAAEDQEESSDDEEIFVSNHNRAQSISWRWLL